MTLFEELKRRGLLAQLTDEKEIKELINAGKATFYIGFDPTADSLHVGHFMALCLMKRLQMAGNKPIVLLGGGTGMIGDPSGKTDMRKMMTRETIEHNVECFKKQMSRFIDFSEGKALAVNNADWLLDLNYVDVLRDVGACFSVNKMLTFECYKQRMERGLTFLEFNYMIMQSYDFYRLFQDYGCNMQFGGDDQWANMLGGTELIRKKLGKDAYAMTITLLLNSEGKKMGKTEKGAVWLDPAKTSPYEFYQYWRNVNDADVIKCLKMLTFVPVEEIEDMEQHMEGAQFNKAKELLGQAGFSNVKTEEVESLKPKGEVIHQSTAKNAEIDVNTEIVLQISKGPEETTGPTQATTPKDPNEPVTIGVQFSLPERDEPYILSIFLNGKEVIESREIVPGTSSFVCDLTGTGTQTYDVYIDGEYYQSKEVPFN